jgi:hypothetical protein
MVLCNDSSFAACSWEAYAASKTWALTSGDGTKNVYVMFRNATFDQTPILGDSITLATPGSTSGTAGGGGGATPAPAPTTTTTTTPAAAPETTTTTTPAAAPVSTAQVVTTPSDVNSILSAFSLTRDTVSESKYATLVTADLKAFSVTASATQTAAITNFVVYGISNATIKLGAGERRALVRDYLETVVRPDVVWSDIEKLATGQKPVSRNLKQEQAQVARVLATFKSLVGHTPNFKNAKEDLAWNTMMYRIRFTRDLAKEQAGIVKFKAIFGRTPSTPLAWATVRAWGYALK